MTQPLHFDDVTIHRIVEDEYSFESAKTFFTNISDAQIDDGRQWMRARGLLGLDEIDQIILCFQSYVVRTPTRTILIDSCVGKDKLRPHRKMPLITHNKWMEGLAAIGLTVEDIDVVMCTHLHVDHVGWNTQLLDGRWVPTFPNAKYLFSEKEFNFWKQRHDDVGVPYFEDSVAPIVDLNLHRFVKSSTVLDDYIRILPTPGHTIDHFSVAVGNGSDAAVFTGDLLHSPLQVRYPELSIKADYNPAQAIETRRRFFERYCNTNTVCCSSHFPSPSRMLISRGPNGYECDTLD